MPVHVVIPKEQADGEHRVALVPPVVERLRALGADVHLEKGAGEATYYPDQAYGDSVQIVEDPQALWPSADLILTVQPLALERIDRLRAGAVVVGFMQPHRDPERVQRLCERRVTAFGMELIPRIARAQSMDPLSSQAAVAGYKAALMAADLSGRFFPMLTTAAGTIRPAKVLVIGAGVAGLQAIATCRRLGAVVNAFDVRRSAREQVQSLGAKFLEIELDAESAGGYARELNEEEKAREGELIARHVGEADAVITTAAIPGRPAPRIITKDMVDAMRPGSVIIDLAAESGGNCELTRPGEQLILHRGAIIYGPLNVPSMLPVHASEMYAKNLLSFVSLILKDGAISIDWEDEILKSSVLVHDGEIRHGPTRERIERAGS